MKQGQFVTIFLVRALYDTFTARWNFFKHVSIVSDHTTDWVALYRPHRQFVCHFGSWSRSYLHKPPGINILFERKNLFSHEYFTDFVLILSLQVFREVKVNKQQMFNFRIGLQKYVITALQLIHLAKKSAG